MKDLAAAAGVSQRRFIEGLPGFNDHIPSGIRMGMDGWLYVSVGDKGIPKMTRKEEGAGSEHVADMFSGKSGVSGAARFEEGQWTSLETGCPIFIHAVGAADCEVEEVIHRHGVAIVIGRVVATMTNATEMPLIHHRGRVVSLTALP